MPAKPVRMFCTRNLSRVLCNHIFVRSTRTFRVQLTRVQLITALLSKFARESWMHADASSRYCRVTYGAYQCWCACVHARSSSFCACMCSSLSLSLVYAHRASIIYAHHRTDGATSRPLLPNRHSNDIYLTDQRALSFWILRSLPYFNFLFETSTLFTILYFISLFVSFTNVEIGWRLRNVKTITIYIGIFYGDWKI